MTRPGPQYGQMGKGKNGMDKYTELNAKAAFGFLINAMEGGGDRGKSFPRSDAEDMNQGLRFIPGEVTVARRRGERVEFIQQCQNECCWYWLFPNESKTFYWSRWNYEQIAGDNGVELKTNEYGSKVGDAGRCPFCGNAHTKGGHIQAENL